MKSQGHSDVSTATQSISEHASGNDGDAGDTIGVLTGISIFIKEHLISFIIFFRLTKSTQNKV